MFRNWFDKNISKASENIIGEGEMRKKPKQKTILAV